MEQEADSSDTDGDGEQIYDQHQRDKSTGSGLVLAVPAMVLDCQTAIPGAGPQVVTGAEYENLVTDNQYYEQVEFGKHVLAARVARVQDSDSLYSIPQVAPSSASASSAASTTRLTASLVKGLTLGKLADSLASIRKTFSRKKLQRSEQPPPPQRTVNMINQNQQKRLEDMYSKPNKFSLPVVPDTTSSPSLVIVTKKTMTMVRRTAEEDSKSYMSVHVQSAENTAATCGDLSMCTYCGCSALKLKKYSVMLLLVSSLVTLLTVGLYFMSDNVVTVTPDTAAGPATSGLAPSRRSFIYESVDRRVDRATTWKDYNQINWGTASFRPATTPSSSGSQSPSSAVSWSSWSAWSQCSRNPCIKGETVARSRRCQRRDTGGEADTKLCVEQGGGHVEMEPCFCF